ncbi:hypothetical protein [Pedobacter xixiisoli]|nr:hypothetical protein [Pedobacter xixiisoli]
MSKDGGKTWQNVSSLSFNAVKSVGNTAILVGGNGQIYQLAIAH